MAYISVFDMLKIGVGPSSSHTLGPWRAAEQFLIELKNKNVFNTITKVNVQLYGSLSLTGKGHATDSAAMLGLLGQNPVTMPVNNIPVLLNEIKNSKKLNLANQKLIDFEIEKQIIFNKNFLPFHPNGITFEAFENENLIYTSTFYSIGGGFIIKENPDEIKSTENSIKYPFPIENADELLNYCVTQNKKISEIVFANELTVRSENQINADLLKIWDTMLECMYIGCHTEGILPGGLEVKRRAFDIHQHLKGDLVYNNQHEWLLAIRKTEVKFRAILKWVSCFALSVNEVNASLGRVVTAPTNGSAGVIPAVLMYYMVIENHNATNEHVKQFLLVAGEIGSIFKKGATISAAMGGCQAEIGVSSAMAAAALCELLGGSPQQCLIAAEIAMEHHLGLTCDPVGGLVQIPCIERNSMGAIKAINAAELALETDPKNVKVPLDKVISTMWETAKDMNSKYKETSTGGLAIKVNSPDC
ncbi:MAG: L-serine ammonia-lyase [Bacteroidetes bacterium]|nr:L-serine ammonia-lyase [Bacteroidota bacterium]